MITQRTLELLKNPSDIQIEDLNILEREMSYYPYMQSLKAVYLYGNHLLQKDNNRELLSLTAAYTTDKKILYHLIQKNDTETVPQENENTNHQLNIATPEEVKSEVEVEKPEENENIEEIEISEDSNETIETEKEEYQEENIEEIALAEDTPSENLTIPVEKKESNQISFDNNSDNILPEVKFTPTNVESFQPNTAPTPPTNKYDEEMKRLIAEVEAKMAKNRKSKEKPKEEEEIITADINFSESEREEPMEILPIQEPDEPLISETATDWKPLTFTPNTPDALLEKTQQTSISREQEPKNLPSDKPIREEQKTQEIKEETSVSQSNIPRFINTWQSWLKLDKTESTTIDRVEPKENKVEDIKAKAIEVFLENNPKISKLNKEESDYILKDRGDDISHLMTETLANLYVEQRLYTKAIRAFKILIEKHPHKKDYFKEKIKETKELKMGRT